jgi:hypothetical protein
MRAPSPLGVAARMGRLNHDSPEELEPRKG